MIMTENEIVRNWKNSKEPFKQLGILAQLNSTTKNNIIKIIMDSGEDPYRTTPFYGPESTGKIKRKKTENENRSAKKKLTPLKKKFAKVDTVTVEDKIRTTECVKLIAEGNLIRDISALKDISRAHINKLLATYLEEKYKS